MDWKASQITSLTIVYSAVYSGADRRKHHSSASLGFVRGIHRWPVNSPHKWTVTRKMFPFDDVIMFVRDVSDSLRNSSNSISDTHNLVYQEYDCLYHWIKWKNCVWQFLAWLDYFTLHRLGAMEVCALAMLFVIMLYIHHSTMWFYYYLGLDSGISALISCFFFAGYYVTLETDQVVVQPSTVTPEDDANLHFQIFTFMTKSGEPSVPGPSLPSSHPRTLNGPYEPSESS